MRQEKVYCKNCKFCEKPYLSKPFLYHYDDFLGSICKNEKTMLDTPFDKVYQSIFKINMNNDCLYFKSKNE